MHTQLITDTSRNSSLQTVATEVSLWDERKGMRFVYQLSRGLMKNRPLERGIVGMCQLF